MLLLDRCPAGKVEVTDNLTGLRHCSSSPCGHWTCRNGGTCVAQSQHKTICQCPEGYKGRWCEISQVKAGRPVGLSSGSILAISMCLLVFLGRKASTFFFSFFLSVFKSCILLNWIKCFSLGCCDQYFSFSGNHQLGAHLRMLGDIYLQFLCLKPLEVNLGLLSSRITYFQSFVNKDFYLCANLCAAISIWNSHLPRALTFILRRIYS